MFEVLFVALRLHRLRIKSVARWTTEKLRVVLILAASKPKSSLIRRLLGLTAKCRLVFNRLHMACILGPTANRRQATPAAST